MLIGQVTGTACLMACMAIVHAIESGLHTLIEAHDREHVAEERSRKVESSSLGSVESVTSSFVGPS